MHAIDHELEKWLEFEVGVDRNVDKGTIASANFSPSPKEIHKYR